MSIILRERKLKSGKTSFYLEYNFYGKKWTEFLKIDFGEKGKKYSEEKRAAEAIRDQRKLDHFYSSNNIPNKNKSKLNLVEYYHKKVLDRPPGRPAWTNSYLKLKTFANDCIRFNEVSSEWLENYKKFLLSEVSQNTAHHYFSNLSTVFNEAVKEGIIDINPCRKVKYIAMKEVKREYLDEDEIKRLINTKCQVPETKRSFLFACFTGLRLSDIYNLAWDNIRKDQVEFRQLKTRSVEYVPLNKNAKELLNSNIPENVKPLPNVKIFNLPTKSHQNLVIKKWTKLAGINKNISFHSSRHTFATLALTNGVDLYTVSKLLGHKDIETTQIYAKIVDKKKRKAVESFPYFNFQ